MELKRVVVTGLGAVTPVGNTVPEFWENLINGVSGAGHLLHRSQAFASGQTNAMTSSTAKKPARWVFI